MKTWKTAALGIFAAAVLGVLSGCGMIPSKAGDLSVTFSMLNDGTDRGLLQITNSGDSEYCCGYEDYTLQYRTGLSWKAVPVNDYAADSDGSYLGVLSAGACTEFPLTLWRNGLLEPGRYRLLLEIARGDAKHCGKYIPPDLRYTDVLSGYTVYSPPESVERVTLAAEFTLQENFACSTAEVLSDERLQRQEASTEQLDRLLEYFDSQWDKALPENDPSRYPDDFSGAYINTDGDLVAMIYCPTYNVFYYENCVSRFREVTENPDLLCRSAHLSFRSLLSFERIIRPYMAKPELGFDLLTLSVDNCHNCLQATMTSVDDTSIRAFWDVLRENVAGMGENGIPGLVQFSEGTPVEN